MKIWAFVAVMATFMATGAYLVVTEHYGWAWIPFVLAGSVRYREHEESK